MQKIELMTFRLTKRILFAILLL